MGDSTSSATEALGGVKDADGTQSSPVGADETLAGAIEADPLIILSNDASAAEPDHSLPALENVAAVLRDPAAVSVADESTPSVKTFPGQAETDIEQPTPGGAVEETLATTIEGNASIVPNLMSADEPALEAAAPEPVIAVAEESVTVSVLGDATPSIAEAPGMEGGVDVAQPNHAGAEKTVVGAVEDRIKGLDDDEPTHITLSLRDVTSAAPGSIAVPVTGGPSLAAKETLEMSEDADIGQSTLVAGEETGRATMQPSAATDAIDDTLVEQRASGTASPEQITCLLYTSPSPRDS